MNRPFRNKLLRAAIFCFFPAGIFLFLTLPVQGEILLQDTVWEGEVLVEEDILIPQGITLTVKPGARIMVSPAESTKTDPEYMSSLTEITVRGSLRVEGMPDSPAVFRLHPAAEESDRTWAGIIIDGGTAVIRSCTVRDAETGIWLISGRADISGSTLASNRYGMVAQKKEISVTVADSRITGNDYGLLALNGATVNRVNTGITENRKKDIHIMPAAEINGQPPDYGPPVSRDRRDVGDEVLLGDVVWQGYVLVTGRVRVPADSRLIILPGTVVEFSRKDTNGDTIGENGLMLQGVLIAKGTAEKPIVFRSAEKEGAKGDWDAVNIMNSDGAMNIIEHCRFEDAYRGLHFHFSNVAVHRCVFRNNYRGIQFQESTVDLRGNHFYANSSAIQARDSEILFAGNRIEQNIFGANFFRAHLTVSDNRFSRNLDFGLKIREGFPSVTGNVFDHNRFGLMFSDTSYGITAGNLVLRNSESGLSMRSGANMEISGNFIQANGLSGIAVRDVAAVIRDNHISENGERGIGVISFQGAITRNSFSNNRLYAIGVEDEHDAAAPFNWFDSSDVEPLIYDQVDDPARGRLQYAPVAEEPFLFKWPLAEIPVDLDWSGRIGVPQTLSVPADTTLSILPGTGILFAGDTGMHVRGSLLALGSDDRRITFTAAEGQKPGIWGEILVEYSPDSRFSNCDFQYAAWAIHSHFSPLSITGCSFRNNEGGVRFRSGPLQIRNSLFRDNNIGIRAFRGTAEISSNVITGNAKGIFVREQGGGLTITGNNISGNIDYNIWVGDFNSEDIQAPGNWWGTDDPAGQFFDGRREPGIGLIHFEPVLKDPPDISIVDKEL
ncbi:MAG: NosD domain-containing protein [Desulfobulbaceae bacterium]|nr:NosD domain-containing protein [Desulfobulbaceae bacterium]